MDKASLLEALKARASSAEEPAPRDAKWVAAGDEPRFKVSAAELPAAASFLKEQGFDLLDMVTSVDWVKENRFEMVYFFQKSAAPAEKLFLKADLPRTGEPSAPTLCGLYDAANWQEREVYDLMGIRFEGHPDLRRILLWEGYPGWPLRKDYVHTQDNLDNGSEIGLPKAPAAHAAPGRVVAAPAGAPSAPGASAPSPEGPKP